MNDNWYETAVMAHRPHHIISVVDWANDASPSHIAPIPKEPVPSSATYNVFAWGVNDPEWGNRTLEKEGSDFLASPIGWHKIPAKKTPDYAPGKSPDGDALVNLTTTIGNNVFAHENWEGRNDWLENYRPDAGASLHFDYPYGPKETDDSDALREAKNYINATVTQLFYTVNMIHDIYYRYVCLFC